MKGGLQEFIIKDPKLLINKYLDSIKYAPTYTNLRSKLVPILSRTFKFILDKNTRQKESGKTDFIRLSFNNQKKLDKFEINIIQQNPNEFIINFKSDKSAFSQHIKINDEIKIENIIEYHTSNKKGGNGFSYDVLQPPIAGQPAIKGYLSCCAPIFPGGLIGGKKKLR